MGLLCFRFKFLVSCDFLALSHTHTHTQKSHTCSYTCIILLVYTNTHPQGPLSASLTVGAIAGIAAGAFAVVCCCCTICLIVTIYYCIQRKKSHTTMYVRVPQTTDVCSATPSSSYPSASAHASAPPAAVVMTPIQTEAYVHRPQQEPPPSFYPQAQTHAGEAPSAYNTEYYYPQVETI